MDELWLQTLYSNDSDVYLNILLCKRHIVRKAINTANVYSLYTKQLMFSTEGLFMPLLTAPELFNTKREGKHKVRL